MEYGYTPEDARKVFEIQEYKAGQLLFNSCVGLFAAWKVGPMQKEAALAYPLFRKTWMRYPI